MCVHCVCVGMKGANKKTYNNNKKNLDLMKFHTFFYYYFYSLLISISYFLFQTLFIILFLASCSNLLFASGATTKLILKLKLNKIPITKKI